MRYLIILSLLCFSGCGVDLGLDHDDKDKIKSIVKSVQYSLQGIHLELIELNKNLKA